MTAAASVVVDIADLLRTDPASPGRARRGRVGEGGAGDGPEGRCTVQRSVVLDDMSLGDRCIAEGRVDLDLAVEAAEHGVVAHGSVTGSWRVPCRRCLKEIEASLVVDLAETFVDDPIEGETWPITGERIDLADPVRQAALLAIPLAPVCGPDCAGPVPGRFPTGTAWNQADDDGEPEGDPRWAVLDTLRIDD